MSSVAREVLQTASTTTADPPTWVLLSGAAAGLAFLVATPGSRALLARYRQRVAAAMRDGASPGPMSRPAGRPPPGDLEIRVTQRSEPPSPRAAELSRRMTRNARRAGSVYAAAGLFYCLVVGVSIPYWDPQNSVSALRVFAAGTCLAGFVIPTVNMVAIVRASVLWTVVGLWAAVVLVMGAWLKTPLWLFATIVVGLPTVLGLGVAGRSARAVGPVLFIALALGLFGGAAGIQLAFAFLAASFAEVSIPGALARLSGLSVAGVAAALAFLPTLSNAYRRKWLAEQELRIMTWWLIFTISLGWVLAPSAQNRALFLYVLFLGFWGLSRLSLRGEPGEKGERPPALLVLRVFGGRRRMEKLMRDVEIHWRYVGPVHLVVGADLAAAYLEPHELLDFLRGRTRRLFLGTEDQVEEQLARADFAPDPDNRFRVTEYFCTDATWRYAVRRLIEGSSAVLADFRGFTRANEGAAFELGQILDLAALPSVVCLVDDSTELTALEQVASAHWSRLSESSPNHGGRAVLRLLRVHGRSSAGLRQVMEGLANAAAR